MLILRLVWFGLFVGLLIACGGAPNAAPTPTPVEVTRQVEVTREIAVEVTREIAVEVTVLVTTTPEPTADATTVTTDESELEAESLANTVAVAEATSESAPAGCWPWTEAHLHLGESGCVEGVVSGTGQSTSVFFINFSPDRTTFYGVSFDWGWEELAGECIRLTGTISEYQGRPQLIVNDPSQVTYCGGGGSPPAFPR